MKESSMRDTAATITSATVSGVSGVTVATGTLATINQYAPLIGICISLVSLLVAIGFYAMNRRREKVLEHIYRKNLKEELRAELLKELENDKPHYD